MIEVIVFISGLAVMILEIIGVRILAPYVGTSIYTWSSLIGIILGSLSIGYWWGGKLSDRKPTLKLLSIIIFASAIVIGFIAIIKDNFLSYIGGVIQDIRIASILDSVILFSIPSILLGAVIPYAIRLKLKTYKKSGLTVGNLYAISTIGSILGTFLSGFFLIPNLANTKILILLSITLIIISVASYSRHLLKFKIVVLLLFLFSIKLFDIHQENINKSGIIITESPYNYIKIYQEIDKRNNLKIRYLTTDKNFTQSAVYIDENNNFFDLADNYTKFFRLANYFNPDSKYTLMIGAGAYSYPNDFLKRNPTSFIDVVEIDPKITELANKYFDLKENYRLRIFHEDGRVFLNRTKNKYDVIIIDAFLTDTPLFQLTTIEVIKKIYNLLNANGIVMVNIPSAIEGGKGRLLRSQYATFSVVFPQVYIYPVRNARDGYTHQNIILVALKSREKPILKSNNQELNAYLQHLWKANIEVHVPILTDDYAPVEHYMPKSPTRLDD